MAAPTAGSTTLCFDLLPAAHENGIFFAGDGRWSGFLVRAPSHDAPHLTVTHPVYDGLFARTDQ